MAWSLVTFLAVPVIAIEGTGPIETLKRSASIFRQRWGQQITGNIAIGGAVFLLGVLPSAILIVAGVALWSSASFLGALLVVIGAIGLAISMLVSQALSGIFGVALYRYAARRPGRRRLHPRGAGVGREGRSGGRNAPAPPLPHPSHGLELAAKRRGSLEQMPLTPASTSFRMRASVVDGPGDQLDPGELAMRARRG